MLAYAKVNLFLQIGRRLESGLHQLESLVCPISLADSVEVELVSGDLIEVICELSPELEQHMQSCLGPQEYRQLVASLNSESNLAGQALRKINSALGTRHGAVIRIAKLVPIFAGLGGGSGNAAAVLRLCNEQLGGVLSQNELLKLAAELGSDVPQALAGGATLISGSGEVVHPVLAGDGALRTLQERYQLVVIKPNCAISTKLAYASLGRSEVEAPGFASRSQQLAQDWLSAGGSLSEELFANDFEAYVEASEPSVKLIKRVAKSKGCEFVFMSGSGSAFVGVLAVESDAELVVEQIKSELPQEFFVQSCKLICKV